jgi:hypothetical protein
MEKVTSGKVVGFILAVLFAVVIGASMWALLNGEYMSTPPDMKKQAEQTLQIVGFAGAFAALATWWVQGLRCKARLRRALPVCAVYLRGSVLQLRRAAQGAL